MSSRLALLVTVAVTAMLYVAPIGALRQRPPGDIELPPITWACPMNGTLMPDGTIHADVYEDAKGNCSICKMALVAVRLESIWTCPVHSVIAEKEAGTCPIDHRDLMRVTVAVSWTCSGHPEIDQMTPGRCPDGSAMTVKYTPRRGAFLDIWVSAFRAKDLALAMDAQSAQLPTYKRRILESATRRLLRAAWLLDAVGDIGNRDQVTRAYADFGSAVSEIEALFQPTR